jgi:acetyl esterase/lipase
VSGAIRLWDGVAPGSEGWTQQESSFRDPSNDGLRVRNVTTPTIAPYLPDPAVATGTGVVIAPGGGFHMLSMDSEGTDVADWLVERGVAAFVLTYRLVDTGETLADFDRIFRANVARRQAAREAGDTSHLPGGGLAPGIPELARADGEQAMRLVRSRAAEWATDPARVGFMGFSAGGQVATMVALSDDRAARPDFVAAVYGAHVDGHIPADAPPLFSMVCADDPICFDQCITAARRWRRAGRPTELHVYGHGGHGFGMHKLGRPVDGWIDRFGDWLRDEGFLPD